MKLILEKFFEWYRPVLVVIAVFYVIGRLIDDLNPDASENRNLSLYEDSLRKLGKPLSANVDGKEIDAAKLYDVLQSVGYIAPHHSSPRQPIMVELTGTSASLAVRVFRDSNIPFEYWVHYPPNSRREVGRVQTDLFNGF